MTIRKNILGLVCLLGILFLIAEGGAREVVPQVITTTFTETPDEILGDIDTFYDLSPKILESGYQTTIDDSSAFMFSLEGKTRYIIVKEILDGAISLIFLNEGKVVVNEVLYSEDYIIFKVGESNVEFMLHSSTEGIAEIELKLFEQEIPADTNYFELFDVTIRASKEIIFEPTELRILIELTNFGEGPSNIRIEYSVLDLSGREYYRGIDEKIVETNEVIIKEFPNLVIPVGDYVIKTAIYYGDGQEAFSETSFSLAEPSLWEVIKQPLIFIVLILLGFGLVVYFRKKMKAKVKGKIEKKKV